MLWKNIFLKKCNKAFKNGLYLRIIIISFIKII